MVAIGAMVVRLTVALLKGIDAYEDPEKPEVDKHGFWNRFWVSFRGYELMREDGDYWHPFFLGLLELAVYPILMVTGSWIFIGAWLMFKTVGQWQAWKERRCPFNRFLIGNALVLIWSLLILSKMVTLIGK